MGIPLTLSPGPLCSHCPPSRGRLMAIIIIIIIIRTSLKTPRREKPLGGEFFYY